MKVYNILDLFSGAGGFSLGFEMTNRFKVFGWLYKEANCGRCSFSFICNSKITLNYRLGGQHQISFR